MNSGSTERSNTALKAVANDRIMDALLVRLDNGLLDLSALTSRAASVADRFHGSNVCKENKSGQPSPGNVVALLCDKIDVFDRIREVLLDEVKRLEAL